MLSVKIKKTMLLPIHMVILVPLIGSSLPGCTSNTVVKHSGTIQCFQPNNPPEGKAACEVSAAAKVGGNVVFVNDKPIQGNDKSSVFSLPLNIIDGKPNSVISSGITYFNAPAFKKATKYESLAATPDGKWVIAATAFDRYKPGQEGYNMLLAWPAQNWQEAKLVLGPEQDSAASDSVVLRDKFKQALGGVAYFKIEGLAAISSKEEPSRGFFLFGIREIGQDYEHPEYVIKLIKVGYHEDGDNRLRLEDDFKLIDYSQALRKLISNKPTLALSSIEFDQENQTLYLLTSYEESKADEPPPESLGAYLWSLPLLELEKSNPELVVGDPATCQAKLTDANGQASCPVEFKAHKAEGLAALGSKCLLVVFDDDRVKTQVTSKDGKAHERKPESESGYVVLELP